MKIRHLATTFALATGLSLTPAAFADSHNNQFSAPQKKQIESIVHEYLLNNPEVLVEVSRKLQEKQEQQYKQVEANARQTIPKVADQLINSTTSPIAGNSNGSVSVVEFFDYQCPHCKDMTEVIEQLKKQNGQVRIVYKELPIFGKNSIFASKAALAANKQNKYVALHEALMESGNPLTEAKVLKAAKSAGIDTDQLQKDMKSKEVKQELDANLKLASTLGIMGTPAFVVADTKNAKDPSATAFFLPGATNLNTLQGMVSQVESGKKS